MFSPLSIFNVALCSDAGIHISLLKAGTFNASISESGISAPGVYPGSKGSSAAANQPGRALQEFLDEITG